MPGKLEILLWLLANCKVIGSSEGESRRVLFPSSVFSFCCTCSSVWDQLGRKDRYQSWILILFQQDNSYWTIMEQEDCTQGPRAGWWLHWIQMLPPQMFVSLLMEYNPSSCSCCLFGKSQPLTALILNQGSVGRLLSKGAWKIMKKTLSTDSTLADLHFPRKLSWVLHIKKKGLKITVLERFCVTSGLQVFFFLFFYRVLCWGKKKGNLN